MISAVGVQDSKVPFSMIGQLRVLLQGSGKFLAITLLLALMTSGVDILGMLLLPAFVLLTLFPAEGMGSFPRMGVANWAFSLDVSMLIGLMVLIFALRSAISVVSNYVNHRLGHRVSKVLSCRLASRYLGCEMLQLENRAISDINTVINGHTAIFTSQVVMPGLALLNNGVIFTLIIIYLGYMDAQVTGTAIILLSVLGGGYVVGVRRITLRLTNQLAASQGEYQRQIAYAFRGPRETRILQLQSAFLLRMRQALNLRARSAAGLAAIKSSPRALAELAAVVLALSYMIYRSQANADSGEIVAYLSVFAFAGLRLVACFSQITVNLAMIRGGRHVVGKLAEELFLLSGERRIEPENDAGVPGRPGTQADFARFSSLEIRGLSFRYESQSEWVLDGVDLGISRNESIGIVGPSGSGKSTLVDILLGLIQPARGMILVNGESGTLNRPEWWSKVGFVPQTPFIANDSLLNNIAFGCGDGAIDVDQVNRVIDIARLRDVVEKLPNGVRSSIGDLGMKLSGGQRQRVAIARALYFQREILIFDEATSSLDDATEAEIVDAIDGLRHDVTTVVVAHRDSTLRHCDRVLKLENGKLREIALGHA